VSSLEREVGAKQEAIGQYENQLTEIQAKYEACPKPEVVERYVCAVYAHSWVHCMYVGPSLFLRTKWTGIEWNISLFHGMEQIIQLQCSMRSRAGESEGLEFVSIAAMRL